jgi:hypothetical protein
MKLQWRLRLKHVTQLTPSPLRLVYNAMAELRPEFCLAIHPIFSFIAILYLLDCLVLFFAVHVLLQLNILKHCFSLNHRDFGGFRYQSEDQRDLQLAATTLSRQSFPSHIEQSCRAHSLNDYIFWQDNGLAHRSYETKLNLLLRQIPYIKVAPYSPDLNLIEHIRNWTKNWIQDNC